MQPTDYWALVINPGTTSTKIGVIVNERLLLASTLRYSSKEIAQYPSIIDLYNFRKKAILATLKREGSAFLSYLPSAVWTVLFAQSRVALIPSTTR